MDDRRGKRRSQPPSLTTNSSPSALKTKHPLHFPSRRPRLVHFDQCKRLRETQKRLRSLKTTLTRNRRPMAPTRHLLPLHTAPECIARPSFSPGTEFPIITFVLRVLCPQTQSLSGINVYAQVYTCLQIMVLLFIY